MVARPKVVSVEDAIVANQRTDFIPWSRTREPMKPAKPARSDKKYPTTFSPAKSGHVNSRREVVSNPNAQGKALSGQYGLCKGLTCAAVTCG